MKKILKQLRKRTFWAQFLFWSWNLIFLAFILFGFVPTILPDLLEAMRGGEIPILFPIIGIMITIIPILVVLVGFFRLRDQPFKLFVLGYGVEGPLMLLIGIRFFLLRELTPAVLLLFSLAAVGMLALLWELLDPNIEQRGTVASTIRLIGMTLLMIVGIYTAVWFTFYVIPLFVFMIEGIRDFFVNLPQIASDFWRSLRYAWRDGFFYVPFMLLGMLLSAYTATLLVGLPVAVAAIYTRAWARAMRRFKTQNRTMMAYGISAAFMALFIGAFILLNRQPQHRAFQLLETPPTGIDAANNLAENEAAIRRGLLNAYLAQRRYVSAEGEVKHIEEMYKETFLPGPRYSDNVSPLELEEATARAESITSLYETVAQPVLYQPVREHARSDSWWQTVTFEEESAEAAELYQRFFDEPIAEGEKAAIVRSARTTWNAEQALREWQMVDDREVLLMHQEINVTEHGDMADIELHEVYQNQTFQRQEVLYYFSLPESAVINGIWLGNSPDKAEAFAYRVAPRGAAQAVYRSEVRRNVDPALVEQIGPRQYRLRIFPVEPKNWRRGARAEEQVLEQPPLYFWMSYRVIGSHSLPQLAEKRNVYWDASTVHLLNGESVEVAEGDWMPNAVSLVPVQVGQSWRRVDFPNGQTVLARSHDPSQRSAELPEGLQVALVLDRSRSMMAHETAVTQTLNKLRDLNATVDVILTAPEFYTEEPTKVRLADVIGEEILYFGGMNSAELLRQYDQLKADVDYDAIFILTDGSGYELGEPDFEIPRPVAPLWMIHLGGFPLGYDDDTLEAIQASGGGTTDSLEDALVRLAFSFSGERAEHDLVDGYTWLTLPTATVAATYPDAVNDDQLAPLAARRLILGDMVRQRENLDTLESLDQLHAIAVENSIVTPYSSMIVLVNARQEKLLDDLEQGDDRFEREFEEVDDTLGLSVTGVPEPHEYLLLALAVIGLVWHLRQKPKSAVGAGRTT